MDFSEADQRRAREIVQLFTQRESRDELGIGVVRDVFSNATFPGVSVVQTRARYLLIVPWIFRRAVERRSKDQAALWADRTERRMIETLRTGGDEQGLIGREAGVLLKTLPSVIYWSALQRYDILRVPGSIDQVLAAGSRQALQEAEPELIDRTGVVWDPYLPPPPEAFPNMDRLDFVLSEEESAWLRERIVSSCHGSLLAWILSNQVELGLTPGPWDEPWATRLSPDLMRTVNHAELFSLAMHGAALTYNVLLAERCVDLEIGLGDAMLDHHRASLQRWSERIDQRAADLASWNVADFWSFVAAERPGGAPLARRFIDQWIALVLSREHGSPAAARAVAAREKEQKRGQARLANDRLLRQWGGSSGTEPLSFRWGQVRRMVLDINGRRETDAGA